MKTQEYVIIANLIVLIGIAIISFYNFKLAKRKRKDDLAKKRYALYQKFALWFFSEETKKSFHHIQNENKKNRIMREWAREFRTIFPQDISDYINSIMDLTDTDSSMRGDVQLLYGVHSIYQDRVYFVHEEDGFKSFFEPFEKYLKFEE